VWEHLDGGGLPARWNRAAEDLAGLDRKAQGIHRREWAETAREVEDLQDEVATRSPQGDGNHDRSTIILRCSAR